MHTAAYYIKCEDAAILKPTKAKIIICLKFYYWQWICIQNSPTIRLRIYLSDIYHPSPRWTLNTNICMNNSNNGHTSSDASLSTANKLWKNILNMFLLIHMQCNISVSRSFTQTQAHTPPSLFSLHLMIILATIGGGNERRQRKEERGKGG